MAKSTAVGLSVAAILMIIAGSSAVPILATKIQLPSTVRRSSSTSDLSTLYKTGGEAAPLCTAHTSVKGLSKKEYYDRLLSVFLDLTNRSGYLQAKAKEYFDPNNEMNECDSIFTGLNPLLTYYPLTEKSPLNQLVEYYFNLTRFALATAEALVYEEQREIKLQDSFYHELRDVKSLLHEGAVNVRKVLVAEGHECVTDQYSSVGIVLETDACPSRYVAMMTIMSQLNTVSSQALSLLSIHWKTMQD